MSSRTLYILFAVSLLSLGVAFIVPALSRRPAASGLDLPVVKALAFPDRDAAMVWVIRNQFGRRNLTVFARAELALKLEPLIQAKAKENLKTAKAGVRGGSPSQISAKAIDTRSSVAKAAGVSHETIRAAKYVAEHADEETKAALRKNPNLKLHRVAKDVKEKRQRDERQSKRTAAAKAEGVSIGQAIAKAYKPLAEEHAAEGRKSGASKGGKTAGRGRPIASGATCPKGNRDESARTNEVAAKAA